MAHLNYHPAPGLGDLLPGYFVVPQNPVRAGMSNGLVPSVQGMAPGKVMKIRSMGEILPAKWSVPQNPLIRNLSGLGCGCSGNCGGMSGLGDTGSITDMFTNSSIISGIPDGVIYAGAALAVYMLMSPGGKGYREATAGARSKHRGFKRVARAIAA